ncbi:exonuclease domain-containing protein [Salinicoccus hispanicus]|uniref:3'-5' exonuclease DinG n=1 Tax=Salinicoccus hispanicus TaxID=157225 RepID=A0A6N8U2B7_9STAP|nr:exonuclease domain-containing protein [Salinicoccus hispanicus]MXQ50291.1 DEAD/DEAH box helicase [Salinicoccus hispanicus]
MLNEKFAVVDLETAGNNKNKDSIIQLGIVIVQNFKVVETYTTFLSDETELTPFIKELTSIETSMLEDAPRFKDVAHEIAALLDGCIFTAHNVEFDFGFLQSAFRKCGIRYSPNHLLDTVELARIFLPTLERLQLNEIAQSLGLGLSNAHRADEDALATAELLIHLLGKITALNTETQKQLYHLSKALKYNLSDVLFSIIAESEDRQPVDLDHYGSFFMKQAPRMDTHLQPVTVRELYESYVAYSGNEYREEQLRLANEIFEALEQDDNLVVEAYTGVGKTLAFLIAAVSFHSLFGRKVLVSTSRKILQNQILRDELTVLEQAAGLSIGAASLKGKDNYLNLDAFELLLSLEENNTEIVQLKMKLLVWLLETDTGDLAEIHLKGPERSYYRTASIQAGESSNHLFFERALSEAERSAFTVTNHYFLMECLHHLSDVGSIIVDEAHQLKRALEERMRTTFSYQAMKFFIGQIGTAGQDRLLTTYINHNNEMSVYLLEDILKHLNQNIDRIFGAASAGNPEDMRHHIEVSIHHVSIFLGTIRGTQNYQVLYNHMHHYQKMLGSLERGIRTGNYSLETDRNMQKIKVHIHEGDMASLRARAANVTATIMLSGTLEVNESFDHLDYWYGEEYFKTLVIRNEALFRQTKIFVPEDIPVYDVQDDDFIATIVEYIAIYLSETDQKLMVLFSNFELLDKVYEYTEDIQTFEDFVILKQSRATTTEKLLAQFNQLDKCVLLGTSSFNEGINIQTAGTKCLMLTKLPFPVPKESGFKSFYRTDLPEAVFQFRQIAGRIHRRPEEKGLLLLFDKRVLNRRYKDAFLKYFPSENIIQGDGESFKALLRDL